MYDLGDGLLLDLPHFMTTNSVPATVEATAKATVVAAAVAATETAAHGGGPIGAIGAASGRHRRGRRTSDLWRC